MARLDLQNDPVKYNLYIKWANMIQRCGTPTNPNYHNYGARGIKVCKEWLKFDNFYSDMLSGFKIGLTLDRTDTNKGYSKDNCRWVTWRVQQNNRRDNHFIEYLGIRDTIANWADYFGINQSKLWYRLYKFNWPVGRALGVELG